MMSRSLAFASLFALAASTTIGCSSGAEEDPIVSNDDGTGSSTDDITGVDQTKVKRQSIGNCWIYATSSWLEALNKTETGVEKDTSESWLTYWHWYEQLANGRAATEISTGGSWGTAVDIITRYGIVLEKDFIATEANQEMSARQSSALNAINLSLKSGALKDPAARRNRTLVRSELDKAWGLDAATKTRLDTVFGAGVAKTLDKSYATRAPGNGIIRAQDFPVKLKDPATKQLKTASLADAIGKSAGFFGPRTGTLAWNDATYPSNAAGRRAFQKRIQNALHDHMPVILSWRVDFNALTQDAHFSLDQLNRMGPGRQGGHMTVLHDYQANVPGIGLLKAGEDATPAQMQAALSDDTKILFLRVKNSWGGIRPDRWNQAAIPGYHDLEMPYLDGPIKECDEVETGSPTPDQCHGNTVPFWDVTLPAGY